MFKFSDFLARFANILFRKSGFYSIKLKKSSFFLDEIQLKEYYFGKPYLSDRYYKLTLDDKYVIFDKTLSSDELQKYANEKLPFWKISWKDYDPKNFWEIARGWQWLPAIIKAKEVNNTQEIINKIICWLDKNHYPNGLAWSVGLDVAIRAMNLFIIYQITKEKILLRYIYDHFLYLKKMIYYSRGTIRNNHYLGELTSLAILSLFFNDKNTVKLKKLLEIEIDRQFYSEGVNFEQSIRYHKFSLEFVFLAKYFLGIEKEQILERGAKFLLAVKKPDDTWPSVGDDDLGCVFRLNGNPLSEDYFDILSLCAPFTKNNYLSSAARFFSENTKEILKNASNQKPPQTTFLFPEGGFFIHRTGWGGKDSYFLIKFGLHKWHAHADLFHIELSMGGIPIFIDSGTFRYNNVLQERKYFRSTAAHNTLEFNGSDQTKQFTNFRWCTPAKVIKWNSKEDAEKLFFSAIHDGYLKRFNILHERKVSIDRNLNWIKVIDVVKGGGKGQAKIYWHFSPELRIKKIEESNIMIYRDNMGIVKICLSSKNIFKTRIIETPYSPMYGVKREQPTLVIEFEKKDSDIIQIISHFEGI